MLKKAIITIAPSGGRSTIAQRDPQVPSLSVGSRDVGSPTSCSRISSNPLATLRITRVLAGGDYAIRSRHRQEQTADA